MSCCIAKKIELFYDLTGETFNPDWTTFNVFDIIRSLITRNGANTPYAEWRPAFINWNYLSDIPINPWGGCVEYSTPYGLGYGDVISSSNPVFTSFSTSGTNLAAGLDWIINFGGCGEYQEAILFWYRRRDNLNFKWNTNSNDPPLNNRGYSEQSLLDGYDIYISDGDFAVINGVAQVTNNLQTSANMIKQAMLSTGAAQVINQCDIEYLSKVLASGPQIDWVTEVLTASNINCLLSEIENENYYGRNILYQILPFVSQMSDKTYTSLNTNNYIKNTFNLLQKIGTKYGVNIFIPPNSTATFTSNFLSENGANIAINTNPQPLYRNRNLGGGYSLAYSVDGLSFKALYGPHKSDNATSSSVITRYQNPLITTKQFVYNEFLVNNRIIGYNLCDPSDFFFPSVPRVEFHGLGGAKIQTSTKCSSACDNSIDFGFGGVYQIDIINPGSNYTSIPSVSINGGGGSGAQAKAFLVPGAITNISLNSGGQGYFRQPIVLITGGGGTGAKAIAQVDSDTGEITSINLVSSGTGYVTKPNIQIIGCGNGASAEINFQSSGQIDRIEMISNGSNYGTQPNIAINGGGGGGATAEAKWAGRCVRWIGRDQGGDDDPTDEINSITKLDSDQICKGDIYGQTSIAVPDGLPSSIYAIISGSYKDDLIINGQVINCGKFANGKTSDAQVCNTGTRSISNYVIPVNGSISIAIKHNSGDTANYDLCVFFATSPGIPNNTRNISEIPFFDPLYNNGTNDNTIDGNASPISLTYTTSNNVTLVLDNIVIEYLRSSSTPSCHAFIQENSEDSKCYSLTTASPMVPAVGGSNNYMTVTHGTSTYYLPTIWWYGGLTGEEIAAQGGLITDPLGRHYHRAIGESLVGSHYAVPQENISCDYSYSGCNNTTIVFNVPYTGTLILSSALSENYDYSISWNGFTRSGQAAQSSVIGLLKLTAEPSQVTVTFRTTTPPPEDPDDLPNSVNWSMRLQAISNPYVSIARPLAPSLVCFKGMFHPNLGWRLDNKYQNRTAVIRNHQSNFRNNAYRYDYNTGYMYNDEFPLGYNYQFYIAGQSEAKLATINSAKYIGIPTGGGGLFVTNKTEFIQYTPEYSMVLKPVIFNYINLDYDIFNPNNPVNGTLNDFRYTKISNSIIQISSLSGDIDRAMMYFDAYPFSDNSTIILFDGEDRNLTFTTTVSYIDKTTIYLNQSLPSNGFSSGLIAKALNNEDQSYNSILVFRPYITQNDTSHTTGKWGHLSYSYAAIESLNYIRPNRYNNSTLRTSFSTNSAESWSAPMLFIDSSGNKSWYTPITNARLEENKNKQLLTMGYNNTSFNGQFPGGDLIISETVVNADREYIYIGPYVGPLHIRVYLSNIGSSSVKYTINLELDADSGPVSFDITQGTYCDFYVTKANRLPVYAAVYIDTVGFACVSAGSTGFTQSSPYISRVIVKIDDNPWSLYYKTKIGFYKHKLLNNIDYITNASSSEGPLAICNRIISPLKMNTQETLGQSGVDLSSFMDLHIFSNSSDNRPIRSPTGYGSVIFEDFLEPLSNSQYNSIGYDPNRYWINIPRDNLWKFMTSSGIVLEEGKVYKVLTELIYQCTDKASQCASIYAQNICENNYTFDISVLYQFLGLSGDDINFFDIATITFPNGCSTLDYCCSRYDPSSWEYSNCLVQQNSAQYNCFDFWNNPNRGQEFDCTADLNTPSPPQLNPDPECQDDSDSPPNDDNPDDNKIKGRIRPGQATYIYFKLKDNIRPYLDQLNTTPFYFLPDISTSQLPCSSTNYSSIGTSFKFNYFCTTVREDCDYIMPRNYSAGAEYVPGQLIDLSPLATARAKGGGFVGDPSLPIVLKNEEIYRQMINPRFPVSLPFKEYDTQSITPNIYTHKFIVKGDICVQTGQLFSIQIGPVLCNFDISGSVDDGFYLVSTYFDPIEIIPGKEKDNRNEEQYITRIFTGCEVVGSHSCGSYYGEPCAEGDNDCLGTCNGQDISCDNLPQYFGPDYELVSCRDISDPEDYRIECRPCNNETCASTLSYVEFQDAECFCPEWATLSDGNICVVSKTFDLLEYDWYGSGRECGYDTISNTYSYCDNGYCGDGLHEFSTTCYGAMSPNPQEQIDAYNNACQDIENVLEFEQTYTGRQWLSYRNDDYIQPVIDAYVANNNENISMGICQNRCYCSTRDFDCGWCDCCHCQRQSQEQSCIAGCYSQGVTLHVVCEQVASNDVYSWYYPYGYNNYYYNNCYNSICLGAYWNYSYNYWYGIRYFSCGQSDWSPCDSDKIKEYHGNPVYSYATSVGCDTSRGGCPVCTYEYESKPYDIQVYNIVPSYKIVYRDYTVVRKTKLRFLDPVQDIASNLSTIKILNKKYEAKYRYTGDDDDDEQDPPGNAINCNCITYSVNLNIAFDVYPDVVIGTVSGSDKKLCLPVPLNNTFRCADISFINYNSNIMMCDEVVVDKNYCDIGII